MPTANRLATLKYQFLGMLADNFKVTCANVDCRHQSTDNEDFRILYIAGLGTVTLCNSCAEKLKAHKVKVEGFDKEEKFTDPFGATLRQRIATIDDIERQQQLKLDKAA